jgi:hypothetical protein
MTWLAALRDHPERPPVAQRMVLVSLAQRMDWSTGCGFASTSQLADDADCSKPTVLRATGWGRAAGMLVQARRGHRLGDGRKVASEWRLALPELATETTSQGVTGETLNGASRYQPDHLKVSANGSQGVTTDPPSRTSSSRTSSSAFAGSADARPAQASPEDDKWRRCFKCSGPVEDDGTCSYCSNAALDMPMPGFPGMACCGRQLTAREIYAMDAGTRQLARSGELVCGTPECLHADSTCAKCGAELSDEPDSLCWACLGISRDEVTR